VTNALPTIRLYLWPHRLLYLGPGMDTGMHRHHAAQLCVGLDGPLRLRARKDAGWDEHRGFYVPPDEPHEFIATATSTAIVYVEAESAEFATLQAQMQGATVIRDADPRSSAIEALRQLAIVGSSVEQADATCLAWMGLTEAAQQRRMLDPRIVDSLALIRSRLDQPMRLSVLAGALNMSPSWLSHQFTEQVGMPLRRYVLWQRLWRAVESALKGCTLTEAAHAAGFSDSSHLSRTFRGTFGVAPSFLFGRRDQIFVRFSDA
jgi:AraC-like DNA-binding protein